MTFTLPFGGGSAAFWRRMAASHHVRVLAICAAFAAMLAAGVHSGRDFASLLSAALSRPAVLGSGAPSAASATAAAPRVVDPVARFQETRIGHMLFSSYNSDICRRVFFDNNTGASFEAGQAECGYSAESAEVVRQDRAQQVLRSFRK